MSAIHQVTELVRMPMSWEDFVDLPETVHAEYVDGVAIVSPPATGPHAWLGDQLRSLLQRSLPGLYVVRELGLGLGDARRIPDVAVVRSLEEKTFTAEVPVLVVEVLSRSTESEDRGPKAVEYAAAGVQQYWLVDRFTPAIEILENRNGEWVGWAVIGADHPRAEIRVGDHGTVDIDIDQLLTR